MDIMRPSEGCVAGSIPAGRTTSSRRSCARRRGPAGYTRPALPTPRPPHHRPVRLSRLAAAWAGLAALLLALAAPLGAQTASATAPTTTEPALPPPPATQAVRQRLALVVGVGRVGGQEVLPSALRDTRALEKAFTRAGYEVIRRDNPGAAELRAAFAELRRRLSPDGLGLVYLVAPMAQVDGRNLVVPADAALNDSAEAAATAALLRVVGVPLQEALDTLAGPTEAPRVLIADGAWRIGPLARLAPPGLARQRTLPGMVVMLGHAPAALQDLPVMPPEPSAPPGSQDPREIAGSRFARVLAEALALPGITVTEALRAVRLEVLDGSDSRTQPWLAGTLSTRVFLSEPEKATAPVPNAAAAAASGPILVPAVTPPPPMVAVVPIAVPIAGPAASAATPAPAASAPERPPTDGRTVRAPGQGERPVLQARANRFGHAEGDVLSYDRLDVRKDELIERYVIGIDRVAEDDGLVATGGRWTLDAEGRTVQLRREDGSEARFAPAEGWWWARPVSGESRTLAFAEDYREAREAGGAQGRIEWRATAQVGTPRLLETPAGEFEVLPIRSTGEGVDSAEGRAPRTLRITRVVYLAPRLGVPVAMDLELDDAEGRALKRERIELTHAQQARTAR